MAAFAVTLSLLVLYYGAKRENERRNAGLQNSNAELTKIFDRQESELKQLRDQVGEMERMRRENVEIRELRGKSGELGKLRLDNQKLRAEVESLQRRLAQIQAESAKLGPPQDESRSSQEEAGRKMLANWTNAQDESRLREQCRGNLRQLAGAKMQWAIDKRKGVNDTPLPRDLFGPALYLKREPVCPAGGRYSIHAIGRNPACSRAGHSLSP